MKYFKEEELCAVDDRYTFSSVAEYCFNWSCGQGWFQFNQNEKLPAGKKVGNRDGTSSIKPKNWSSLISERKLKMYDDKKYVLKILWIKFIIS